MACISLPTAALIAGGVGAAATVYGANKQASASEDANSQNAANVAAADQQAWNEYLMQRGIYGGNAPTGTIPANAPAVNTKLPLWATVSQAPTVVRWVKQGAPAPAAPSWTPGVSGVT